MFDSIPRRWFGAQRFRPSVAFSLTLALAACGGGGSSSGSSDLLPEARFAYLASDAGLSTFGVEPETGTLIPRGRTFSFPYFSGDPGELALHPDGHALYVAESGTGRVVRIELGEETGLPLMDRFSAVSLVSSDVRQRQLLVHPSGAFLYVLLDRTDVNDQAIAILELEPDGSFVAGTETTLPIGFDEFRETRMLLSGDGEALYATESNGVRAQLNAFEVESDGTLTQLDADSTGGGLTLVVMEASRAALNPVNGDLYFLQGGGIGGTPTTMERYTTDTPTRAPAFLESLSVEIDRSGGSGESAVVEPFGRVLAVFGQNSEIATLEVDQASGELTEVDHDPMTAGVQPFHTGTPEFLNDRVKRFDPAGRHLYVAVRGTSAAQAPVIRRFDLDAETARLSVSTETPELHETLSVELEALELAFATREGTPEARPTLAVGRSGDALISYAVDATDGGLTQLSTFAITDPFSDTLAIEPTQRALYVGVTTSTGSRFQRLLIDADTGVVSDPLTVSSDAAPNFLAGELRFFPSGGFAAHVDPSLSTSHPMYSLRVLGVDAGPPVFGGDFLNLFDQFDSPFEVGQNFSGNQTAVPALRPNGSTLYWPNLVDTGSVVEWQLRMFERDDNDEFSDIGQVTPPTFADVELNDLRVEPLGRYLLAVEDLGGGLSELSVYELDLTPGLPSLRDVFSGVGPGFGLDPLGRFVYLAGGGQLRVFRFTRDPSLSPLVRVDANAATAPVDDQPLGLGAVTARLVPDPTGRFLYAVAGASGVKVFRVDPATGALTSQGLATPDALSRLVFLANL
ncbi:MAG: hypothetical protein WD226_09710 [Planctomycetota bacterium]